MSDELLNSVLDGLGPALRDLAGPDLVPFVRALVTQLGHADALTRLGEGRPSPPLADLASSPCPRWFAQLAGVTVPAGLSEDQARQFIAGAGASRRGTRAALEAAVRSTLTGTQTLVLVERDGSPWRLRLITYATETPDPAATLAAALPEKPVGLVMTYVVSPGVSWDQFDDEVDLTWNDAETHTWDQLGSIVPGTYP